MTKYTIGDISRKLNVSNDAVRYYDKEGLLPFAKRNKAGRREFTDDDLGYIEVIDCLKNQEFRLRISPNLLIGVWRGTPHLMNV